MRGGLAVVKLEDWSHPKALLVVVLLVPHNR
jgi:hypothetical protein